MERFDMSELEIMNFALNFNNLINQKDGEIAELSNKNEILKATVSQLLKPGKRLSVEEIKSAKRPVFCRAFNLPKKLSEFYALPCEDKSGVISPRKGIYRYEDYLKTWEAFSEKPIEDGPEKQSAKRFRTVGNFRLSFFVFASETICRTH